MARANPAGAEQALQGMRSGCANRQIWAPACSQSQPAPFPSPTHPQLRNAATLAAASLIKVAKTAKEALAAQEGAARMGPGGVAAAAQEVEEAAVAASMLLGVSGVREAVKQLRRVVLPLARQLAEVLLRWWQRPEQQEADALELAQAAAARSCAYLCCSQLSRGGGPAAGEGEDSQRCGGCRAVW